MLINQKTIIKGKNVILVPYKEDHVRKYHYWMQSEELQRLTASEPLSLEEEFNMQRSWRIDEDKCTFIVLNKEKFEQTKNEVESMIGDTNLFFANCDDRLCAEAEIMIAEPSARGKKCGKEAMLLMFVYGINVLGVKQFTVKISFENEISISMFRNMGFVEFSRCTVFREVTLCKIVDQLWITWLNTVLGEYSIIDDNKKVEI